MANIDKSRKIERLYRNTVIKYRVKIGLIALIFIGCSVLKFQLDSNEHYFNHVTNKLEAQRNYLNQIFSLNQSMNQTNISEESRNKLLEHLDQKIELFKDEYFSLFKGDAKLIGIAQKFPALGDAFFIREKEGEKLIESMNILLVNHHVRYSDFIDKEYAMKVAVLHSHISDSIDQLQSTIRLTIKSEINIIDTWLTILVMLVFIIIFLEWFIIIGPNNNVLKSYIFGLIKREKKNNRQLELERNSNKIKTRFIENITHEIKAPMNGIMGFLYLLSLTKMNREQKDLVYKAELSSKNLLRITNEIMDVSRIISDDIDIMTEEFMVEELVDQVVLQVSEQTVRRGIEIVTEIDTRLPKIISGDTLRVSQILGSLLQYSISNIHSQGELKISTVLISSEQECVEILFSIEYKGNYVNSDQRRKLFEYQADKNPYQVSENQIGMSLPLCAKLAKKIGGSITFDSEKGQSNTIDIFLPFNALNKDRLYSQKDAVRILGGKKVLVVDDLETARFVTQKILQSFEVKVDACESGQRAIKQLLDADKNGEPYEIIIIDYRMPEMDGRELALSIHREFCSGVLTFRPQLVLLTAYGEQYLQKATEEDVFNQVLSKPVSPSKLLDCFYELLSVEVGEWISQFERKSKTSTFKGRKVLVVDDNRVNHQIVTAMLEKVGCYVENLESCNDVIKTIQSNAFDLILMDIKLKDGNGYDCAKLIRDHLGEVTPPIIAMTAEAKDSRKNFESGISGHLMKPLKMDLFYQTLKRFLSD